MRSGVIIGVLAIVALSLAEDAPKEPEPKTSADSNQNKTEVTDKDTDTKEKDGEKYTDRYDNINTDELVANRRLLVPYLKCILDKGRCTPEGKELKAHVKDAMQTACQKCTEKQKAGARKVVNHIKDNEPVYWEELTNKFDPKGEYKPIYLPFLAGQDAKAAQ